MKHFVLITCAALAFSQSVNASLTQTQVRCELKSPAGGLKLSQSPYNAEKFLLTLIKPKAGLLAKLSQSQKIRQVDCQTHVIVDNDTRDGDLWIPRQPCESKDLPFSYYTISFESVRHNTHLMTIDSYLLDGDVGERGTLWLTNLGKHVEPAAFICQILDVSEYR